MNKHNVKRISLWSGPRNISTALMYSFAQRTDTRVYDEPLYAYYLSHSPAKEYHPGVDEILASQENDGSKVIEMMLSVAERPVAFFKNMTHHLLDLDRSFLPRLTNVILTRDPLEMLPSFARVINQPTLDDVGYKLHVELAEYLQSKGIKPIVIDSKNILLNPEKELKRLCALVEIPFDSRMLSWRAGAREEDGVWAPYWYANIHRSVGFIPYKPKKDPFPEKLKPLLSVCQTYYKQLIELDAK